jgi:hypothetical protein
MKSYHEFRRPFVILMIIQQERVWCNGLIGHLQFLVNIIDSGFEFVSLNVLQTVPKIGSINPSKDILEFIYQVREFTFQFIEVYQATFNLILIEVQGFIQMLQYAAVVNDNPTLLVLVWPIGSGDSLQESVVSHGSVEIHYLLYWSIKGNIKS